FGTSDAPSARKMRDALELIRSADPGLAIEGEMHGDSALNAELRLSNFPRARLKEEANLLIMPTLDAANIAFNLLKTAAGDGITIGPILLGARRPVHILTSSATVRRLVNMTALTVVDANASIEATPSGASLSGGCRCRRTDESRVHDTQGRRRSDRGRRPRGVSGRRAQGGEGHGAAAGKESVSHRVRHVGGRDQRRDARGIRR